MTRGRLRLAAAARAGLGAFQQPSRFYFCTARLHLARIQHLPVCTPPPAPEQTAAPKTNTAPDSRDVSAQSKRLE